MEGHWFKFKNREIYLEEDEIFQVHEYYVVQRNADYLRDNYPHLTEDKIMEIAWDWRETELKDGYSNEDALEEMKEKYELHPKFKVNDTFTSTCIFTGGSHMYKVISRTENTLHCKRIYHEIDGTHKGTEDFEIYTDESGREYIILWVYKDHRGIYFAK